jgi:hypothetical protein
VTGFATAKGVFGNENTVAILFEFAVNIVMQLVLQNSRTATQTRLIKKPKQFNI